VSDVLSAQQRVAEHAYDALGGVGRLRRVWPWLGEARMPGRPAAHLLLERRLSPRAEQVEAEQVRRDRRAKFLALRGGKTPLAPFAAPVRLGPVRARWLIAGQIRAAGGRIGAELPHYLTDPTLLRREKLCHWCGGAGEAQMPAGWIPRSWPLEPVTCGLCGGYGRVCAVCATAGGCHCDLADVVVDGCLDAIAAAVGSVADAEVAERAAGMLNSAADLACTTLGLSEVDMRVIKAPCPACGRRDLWADVASPKPDEWSVICRSDLCRCTGPKCGCGRPTRWAGRKHRWPAAEFHALAGRLGVGLPRAA
jgi:hypothetical protein